MSTSDSPDATSARVLRDGTYECSSDVANQTQLVRRLEGVNDTALSCWAECGQAIAHDLVAALASPAEGVCVCYSTCECVRQVGASSGSSSSSGGSSAEGGDSGGRPVSLAVRGDVVDCAADGHAPPYHAYSGVACETKDLCFYNLGGDDDDETAGGTPVEADAGSGSNSGESGSGSSSSDDGSSSSAGHPSAPWRAQCWAYCKEWYPTDLEAAWGDPSRNECCCARSCGCFDGASASEDVVMALARVHRNATVATPYASCKSGDDDGGHVVDTKVLGRRFHSGDLWWFVLVAIISLVALVFFFRVEDIDKHRRRRAESEASEESDRSDSAASASRRTTSARKPSSARNFRRRFWAKVLRGSRRGKRPLMMTTQCRRTDSGSLETTARADSLASIARASSTSSDDSRVYAEADDRPSFSSFASSLESGGSSDFGDDDDVLDVVFEEDQQHRADENAGGGGDDDDDDVPPVFSPREAAAPARDDYYYEGTAAPPPDPPIGGLADDEDDDEDDAEAPPPPRLHHAKAPPPHPLHVDTAV
mmetsp:Transcript_5830/g.24330  ORF Transcript_5830/g.24330 Transcript_5830/m.24330 type:complete len:537 (+) Transcript_5830:269-1879(+)